MPLSKYGGARSNRRKTQAEKEICSSQAQTPRQRTAQAEKFSRHQKGRFAEGAVSRHHGSDGKDPQIDPGRPPRVGVKAATKGLERARAVASAVSADGSMHGQPLGDDALRTVHATHPRLPRVGSHDTLDRDKRQSNGETTRSAEPGCPSPHKPAQNSRACRALARRFGRAAEWFPAAAFPDDRRA